MKRREDILSEIKRLAKENGGRPPGWRLFARETGAREWDWKGKYWARWGDALTEAGFSPNKLNEAYPEDTLLEAYALLARKLGHLPTEAELRLEERNNPELPGYQAFGRFGKKSELVRRLALFCEKRGDLTDVLVLCDNYEPRRKVADDSNTKENVLEGFVYLIKSGRFYKLGRTNAVGRRERELAIQLPEPTRTVHVIRTDDPVGIEAYWHNRFSERRKNGEWFELSAADISAFKRRKFM